jgi:hypothetical protein
MVSLFPIHMSDNRMKRKHFLGALGASALAFVAGSKFGAKKTSENRRTVEADGLPQLKAAPRTVARSERV